MSLEVNLALIQYKLTSILDEMNAPNNYYAMPETSKQISCVMPGKQKEWISRLGMVLEEVKDLTTNGKGGEK
jgi:hypothetical protein